MLIRVRVEIPRISRLRKANEMVKYVILVFVIWMTQNTQATAIEMGKIPYSNSSKSIIANAKCTRWRQVESAGIVWHYSLFEPKLGFCRLCRIAVTRIDSSLTRKRK